jgi:hypothetical protein
MVPIIVNWYNESFRLVIVIFYQFSPFAFRRSMVRDVLLGSFVGVSETRNYFQELNPRSI